MKCKDHIERESVEVCHLCGDPFCEECLVTLGGRPYCIRCLENKLKDDNQVVEGEKSFAEAAVPKSKFWAFIFSLIPGVGYLYLGAMNRGLQTMVIFFGSIFVAGLLGFEQIMALIVPVVMFYSIFDTQQLVNSINTGHKPEDKLFFDPKKIPYTHNWIGWSLIVVGGLAALRNIPIFWPFWSSFNRLLPPVFIIGIGVAILYRNTRKPE